MSEFEQLYRELILDHYKNPRNHGVLEPADARAEGQNPLCGDEVTVSVRLGEGDVIEEVGFDGRGCAISQAATSMLTDLVKGKTALEVAALPKEALLDELGIPLTPVRLKCAILGLGVLKLRCTRPGGRRFPRNGARPPATSCSTERPRVAEVEVCLLEELPPGAMRLVPAGRSTIGVYNCAGRCMRSRIAALTTTGRSARETGSRSSASSSALVTARASTSSPAFR